MIKEQTKTVLEEINRFIVERLNSPDGIVQEFKKSLRNDEDKKISTSPIITWGSSEPVSFKKSLENKSDIELDDIDSEEDYGKEYYLYDPISKYSSMFLTDWLRYKKKEMQNRKNKKPLCIYINSYGGDLLQGFAVMDEIRKCIDDGIPVDTVIDGPCASAATLISIVGSKRYMKENAFMLIHQLSSMSMGTYENNKDAMANQELFMQRIIDIYKKYTKIPENELEEILKHDRFWDFNKCKEYGLVDEAY
jgi:ATP-dependent protease ClpP protease subunit